MKKAVFLFLSLTLTTSLVANAQVDRAFLEILSTTFQDASVCKHACIKNSDSVKVYIYLNEQFNCGGSRCKEPVVVDNWNGVQSLLISDHNRSIFGFAHTIDIGIPAVGRVDTVVVFDRRRIKKKSASLIFHTSNRSLKRALKGRLQLSQSFVKIKCKLGYLEDQWILTNVKLKKFRFKSIADRE